MLSTVFIPEQRLICYYEKNQRVFPITASSLSVYNLYIQFIKLYFVQLKYKQF